MKKIAALVLTLILAFSAVAAMAATPGEVVGTWYGISLLGNSDYGAGIPMGEYRLEINRDGSAQLVLNGTERQYSWKVTDEGVQLSTLSEYDEVYDHYYTESLTLTEDGQLTSENIWNYGEEEGHYYDFVFDREPVDTTLPAKAVAAQEDDFYGEWIAALLVEDGFIYNVVPMGLAAKVEFAQITYYAGENDPAVLLTDYKDGTLTSDGQVFDYNSDKVVYELTEIEGMVCATLYSEGNELYCVYLVSPALASSLVADETVEEAVEDAAP